MKWRTNPLFIEKRSQCRVWAKHDVKNKNTVVFLELKNGEGDVTTIIGGSVCHDTDNYVRKAGYEIALGRAEAALAHKLGVFKYHFNRDRMVGVIDRPINNTDAFSFVWIVSSNRKIMGLVMNNTVAPTPTTGIRESALSIG